MKMKKYQNGNERPGAGEHSKPTVDDEIKQINTEIEEYTKTIDVEKLDAELERLFRQSESIAEEAKA